MTSCTNSQTIDRTDDVQLILKEIIKSFMPPPNVQAPPDLLDSLTDVSNTSHVNLERKTNVIDTIYIFDFGEVHSKKNLKAYQKIWSFQELENSESLSEIYTILVQNQIDYTKLNIGISSILYNEEKDLFICSVSNLWNKYNGMKYNLTLRIDDNKVEIVTIDEISIN